MKRHLTLSVSGWILLGVWCLSAHAQIPKMVIKPTATPLPPAFAFHIQRFALASTKPSTYYWTLTRPPNEAVSIDGNAFKSLASPTLRRWIIEWLSGGTVPIVYMTDKTSAAKLTPSEAQSTQQEVDEFAQFCQNHGEPFFTSSSAK